jgi:D-amino-acid oxidase
MTDKPHIRVIGAGVSGLSTAIILRIRGYPVTIWAKDLPPNTTSNKAAAVWYPFICNPPDKVSKWAKIALDYFEQHIMPDPNSGTKRMKVIEIFDKKKDAEAWWRGDLDCYRRTTPDELPEGYVDGYAVEGLIMETDTYMEYLVKQFVETWKGELIQREIETIDEAFDKDHSIVVNCTGLGSFELLGDTELFPTRGQIVVIKDNGFDHSIFEEEGPNQLAYIIPRLHDIVLGGTAQAHDWNLKIDPQDTQDILRKVGQVRPEFQNITKENILDVRVGLRPSRSSIRLETEQHATGEYLIHNYGHGGSGFTLSWGCATEAADLVDAAAQLP